MKLQNEMHPRIEQLTEKKLIGKSIRMTFANNRTVELWKSFAPRKKEIGHRANACLYSVDIYNNPKFFEHFNPLQEFEKWAAVEVTGFEDIPAGMERLVIPAGQYAVFHYRGKPSEAQATFQYIYGTWLPQSDYEMDNRPYFARMDDRYKGEEPDSEEEFWIPVRQK